MACELIGLSDGTRQVPPGQRRPASAEPIFRANFKARSGLTFERIDGGRFTDFRDATWYVGAGLKQQVVELNGRTTGLAIAA